MRHVLLLLLVALLGSGCAIIRNPANYHASIDQWHDATVAQVDLLEAELQARRVAGDVAGCEEVASTFVFAKYWAGHQRQVDLAAAGLAEAPVDDPVDVPSPSDLCAGPVAVPAPNLPPVN